MSTSSSSQRTDGQLGKFDINDLKSIKVAIRRSHLKVNEQTTPVPILRSIEEPERLIKVIHYKTDEGLHPIFERDDIIVNQSEDAFEKWVCKCGAQKLVCITPDENRSIREDKVKDHRDYRGNKSRNVRSRSRSYEKYKTSQRSTISPSRYHKSNRHSRSPQPSTSNRYDDGKNLGKSRTPPPPPPTQQSKGYREFPKKSPTRYKNRSRSPIPRSPYRRDDDRLHKYRYHSRSPPPPVRHRSPHLRESTRRSRSRSPPPVYHHRSRRSRSRERHYSRSSPHRHDRRSRSPSRYSSRYSSSHHHRSRSRSRSREYKIPAEIKYYPAEEYWLPGPMPPRFIPGGFIQPPPAPPGVFPRGPALVPRVPITLPPFHQPFRQRYPIYNNRIIQPLKPKPKPTTITTTNSSTTTTTTTASTVTTSTATSSKDAAVAVASSSSEKNDQVPVLSSGNNDDGGNKE